MTDDELMDLLANYPALRHACARTDEESAACVAGVYDMYGFPIVKTKYVRDELVDLLRTYTEERA